MSLEKYQAVYTRHEIQVEEVPQTCYTQEIEDPNVNPDTLWLADSLVVDMGNPHKITITIVPGDTLNEEQDYEVLDGNQGPLPREDLTSFES